MLTVEELASKWDDTISRLIRQHGFRPSDIDDIKQDIFVAWIVGGYEKIYDPTKSQPSTFVHNFVSLRLRGYRSRKQRDVLTKAVPLVTDLDSGRGVLIDLIEGTPQVVDQPVEHRLDEGKLKEELQSLSPKGYAGHVKDYWQVYSWIKEGKTQTEIAKITEYSLGTVNGMVKLVRQVMEQCTVKVEVKVE